VAALVVVYPYTPAVQYQLFRASSTGSPQAVQRVVADREIDGNRVIIPKIGVDTPIVEGSSLDVLKTEEGVWHQTGDISGGNFVLAGHRFKYLPPNTSTLYNLDKLAAGDTIAVDWEGRRTIYQVTKLMTVGANDTSILNSDFGQRLTIYTCTDTRQTQRTVAIAQVAANP
jgi:LPXTG-site transpeptidase (sortase) family protein